jgi:MFS family permease
MGGALRQPVFRRIWLASLLSNLGLLIQGVGAAWTMTQMTSAPDLVALVQTAQMAPTMLFALAAGAIADMYDRRRVAMIGLTVALAGAGSLTLLARLGGITPVTLLTFCFVIGLGTTLFSPAWQASVTEQVPPESLPAAVALNSISYNIARSVGPAIGGMILAAAGAVAAFGLTTLLYLPILVVLYRWRRVSIPSRFPPESLARATISGLRYVRHSPSIRIVLTRTLLTGIAGGALGAMMPLVARTLLHGDALTFGLSLGAFGVGAVLGALNITAIRRRMQAETALRVFMVVMAAATAVVAVSPWPLLTWLVLMPAGAAWMLSFNLFNIGIQFAAPRWVAARALSALQVCVAGGVGLGSWGWGLVARAWGVETTLLISAGCLLLMSLIGLWLRMPAMDGRNEEAMEAMDEPDVRLALTGRSGPILVELEYRVDAAQARPFYQLMQQVRLARHRNGCYDWTLSRDVGNPETWVEAYSCPTWLDYLRQRTRTTEAERNLQLRARDFHMGPEPVRVRRRLERPFGSVRWKDEVPDRALDPAAAQPTSTVGA